MPLYNFTVRLSPQDLQKLQQLSELLEVPKSRIIRIALRLLLVDYSKKLELLKEELERRIEIREDLNELIRNP